MNKEQLRTQAKARRRQLNMPEISRLICRHVEAWDAFQQAQTVFLYAAREDEINLLPLAEKHSQKTWFLPRTLPENTLCFHAYRFGDVLQEQRFGIAEPAETTARWQPDEKIDLIFVPALMLDRKGVRLGYGKGCYDRFLSTRPSLPRLVSAVPSELLTETLPQDEWDIPVHSGITQSEHLFFAL